jgi:hypothetical protein
MRAPSAIFGAKVFKLGVPLAQPARLPDEPWRHAKRQCHFTASARPRRTHDIKRPFVYRELGCRSHFAVTVNHVRLPDYSPPYAIALT